jgi:hypothetical protein
MVWKNGGTNETSTKNSLEASTVRSSTSTSFKRHTPPAHRGLTPANSWRSRLRVISMSEHEL